MRNKGSKRPPIAMAHACTKACMRAPEGASAASASAGKEQDCKLLYQGWVGTPTEPIYLQASLNILSAGSVEYEHMERKEHAWQGRKHVSFLSPATVCLTGAAYKHSILHITTRKPTVVYACRSLEQQGH
jgi:hypothetical protein